jgi:hypothetical protein
MKNLKSAIKKDKKKMDYNDLEDHVLTWGISKLSDIQEEVSEIEDDFNIHDDRKRLLLKNLCVPINELLDLLSPLRHDNDCLIEWAFNYLKEFVI